MKQTQIQTFHSSAKPPLPKGYSLSHILTYRKCEYKFLLSFIYKVKVETKYKPLLEGSNVHELISKREFISENKDTQKLLDVAYNFLQNMPENPVFETDYTDKNNPGTFKGKVFDVPFLATFDVHWTEGIGVDWKTSEQKEKYHGEYEIQAYLLNELFKQKYGYQLKKFYFVFLKDGSTYQAQSIYKNAVRTRTETKIKNVLDGIKRLEFKKKMSFACEWCDYQGMCI